MTHTERQNHGFDYQDNIFERGDVRRTDGYTDKWDGYRIVAGKSTPTSIKCCKYRSEIGLGDIRRQSQIDENFSAVIGFWEKTKDNIVEEHEIVIDKDTWKSYFGNIDCFDALYAEMDTISNDRKDEAVWKAFRKKYNDRYGKDSIIKIRFKRDHKNQKRIQCAISYKNFINVVLKDATVVI